MYQLFHVCGHQPPPAGVTGPRANGSLKPPTADSMTRETRAHVQNLFSNVKPDGSHADRQNYANMQGNPSCLKHVSTQL